ncbi:Iron(III)-hydroxamate import system permease protein fhuB [Serratia liquefaciens]|nr:Iron(III)-hydroxamate import system permease protein fhuB [Serratia liquefaciens]
MALTSSRIVLLLLAACLTAAATLTIGPLSFVGLMAPHIARMMGFRRTLPHMVISGLTGGLLLVFADWCGRMMMFPYQIPAGATVDLYRRALLYLFAEKAESLTVLDGFNIPRWRYRLPGLQRCAIW